MVFSAKKSTGTNLTSCLNNWTNIINNKQNMYVIYVYLTRAFDSVDINKLTHKLDKIGIGGHLTFWSRSFLFNRKQCVKVEGITYSDSVV